MLQQDKMVNFILLEFYLKRIEEQQREITENRKRHTGHSYTEVI